LTRPRAIRDAYHARTCYAWRFFDDDDFAAGDMTMAAMAFLMSLAGIDARDDIS
jgi:hypothetical protein